MEALILILGYALYYALLIAGCGVAVMMIREWIIDAIREATHR